MSLTVPAPVSGGPTPLAERALAPDLARGVMLLFIALANSHVFLRTAPLPELGTLDRAVSWATTTFVDARAFPMFGLLLGYGIARIVARQNGSPKQTRKLLRRRSLVLLVIGSLHMVLIFDGEILAVYGGLLFLGLWAVNWKDRTLHVVAWTSLLLIGLVLALSGSDTGDVDTEAMTLPPDFATQIGERVAFLPLMVLSGWIMFICPYLVGLWAGRRRVLEQPVHVERLLVRTAVIGIAAAVLGAQPYALLLLREGTEGSGPELALHQVTGTLGGFGYAALIALVALHLKEGRVVRALAATGQRSMTCYLAQSPVWFVVFTPYLLDFSGRLSITATALLAVTTWLATVLLADRLRAAGRRGPFETLTRRLTYR